MQQSQENLEKNKITVLLFIDWFLPGTASGGPVRSIANMMDHMSKFAKFRVITRNTDYVSDRIYSDITSDSWNVINENVEVYYLSQSEINYSNFKNILKETNFDLVYINGIYSYNFSILPLLLTRKLPVKKIVGARGMLNPQAFSVKRIKKKFFLLLANALKLYSNVYFHATNEDEAKWIKNRIKVYVKIIIAPNFPRKIESVGSIQKIKEVGELKIVSIARISKEKGTLRMLQYVSKLPKGKISLHLFGPIYDKSYWLECKQWIDSCPDYINVEYKGILEGSLIPERLKDYQIFMMPSEGENFGHSILEALSAGLPVIISDLTPWSNLEEQKVGWDIPLDNDQKFESVLEYCLNMNGNQYREWSVSAFNYAKTFVSNPEILEANKRLLIDI